MIVFCFCAIMYILIGNTEGAITAWTVPVIATREGSGTVTTEIPEDKSPGTTVITLAAVGTGDVTYTIESQPTTGKITIDTGGLLSLATGFSFDYETETTYTFVVKAVDDDSPRDTATATITLRIADTNDAPVFTVTQFAGTIADGSGGGTLASPTLSATDADGDGLIYTIINDASGQWEIDGNKLKVVAGETMDAETLDGYEITVKANDGTVDSINTASVWITVTTSAGTRAAVIGVIAMAATVALSTLL